MKIEYTRIGDYEILNLTLKNQNTGEINKYGRLRLNYLKENDKALYTTLLMTNELIIHLTSVSKEALEIARKNKTDFSRKSPLGLENLTKFLIFKEGKTNQMDLYNFFNKIGKEELSVTKSALTEQREKLNPELFVHMNTMFVKSIYEQEEIKTIEETGLIAIGVDGSIFETPNKESIKKELGYAEGSNDKTARVSARAQVSGIYDCINNIMLHASIGKYKTSEKELAVEQIKYVKREYSEQFDKMLFIFDRGYIGVPILIQLMQEKAKFLFRLPATTYKKEIDKMNSNDEIINIPLTISRTKDIKDKELRKIAVEKKEISVRIVKIKLDSNETEILLTNISKEEIATEKMKEVYS